MIILKEMARQENFSNTDKVLAQKYASDFSIPLELAQIVAQRMPEYNEAKIFYSRMLMRKLIIYYGIQLINQELFR